MAATTSRGLPGPSRTATRSEGETPSSTAPVACRTPLRTSLKVLLGASMVSRPLRIVTVGVTGGWFMSVGGSRGAAGGAAAAAAGAGEGTAGSASAGFVAFFLAAERLFFAAGPGGGDPGCGVPGAAAVGVLG